MRAARAVAGVAAHSGAFYPQFRHGFFLPGLLRTEIDRSMKAAGRVRPAAFASASITWLSQAAQQRVGQSDDFNLGSVDQLSDALEGITCTIDDVTTTEITRGRREIRLGIGEGLGDIGAGSRESRRIRELGKEK